jgi:hypothetical protein
VFGIQNSRDQTELLLFVNSFVLRFLQHSIWCCVTGWRSEGMRCVHLEGGPPEPLRMMVSHSLGTLGSAWPMTWLCVLHTGVLRVLLECCVMHRPAGKCLRWFVGKLSSVWDSHRNAVCVILNMTMINYVLWDWRISQQCCWTWVFWDMKGHSAFVLRVTQSDLLGPLDFEMCGTA